VTEAIDAEQLRRRLPMRAAIDALEAAFRTEDLAATPLRTHVETPEGELLIMPAFGRNGVGVKLVTLTEANPSRGLPLVNGVYVLFDPRTQVPLATIDGAALTELRTAAVSGLATRYLARSDAADLVVFGAGVQARSHVEAMVSERPVRSVTVVSRTPGPAEVLAEYARSRFGVEAATGGANAVAGGDLVCCCTTSPTPLFEGGRLAAGTHVNAIGAYRADARELDADTVRRARVVVETREVAAAEAGDLVIPTNEGVIGPDHVVADLAELVRGALVRRSDADVTVFKSVGMAFEDLVVARALMDAP
jgi:ornithine cyclodeaminase/alanine dehydrogenase-like protein (mu-crystallin family)